ncbi:hypothetical protein K501DRAFT_280832 [Backusella circina FSU 941]|nr:hypothetical protein K501DRAFT_280832 [Backusella circina FSU 941]
MKWSFVCEKKRASLDNEEDIQELRKSSQSLTSLGKEKGVKTDTKSKSGFGSGELNEFFLRKPASKKKAFDYWNEYAKGNFDKLLQEVINEDQTNLTPSGNTAGVQASSASSGDTASERKSKKDNNTRSCTATFSAIPRMDLPDDIQSAINTTLNENVVSTSYHVIDLSVKVRGVMLLLNENSFQKNSSCNIVLTPEKEFQISTLLLEGYILGANVTGVVPPINQSLWLQLEEEKSWALHIHYNNKRT